MVENHHKRVAIGARYFRVTGDSRRVSSRNRRQIYRVAILTTQVARARSHFVVASFVTKTTTHVASVYHRRKGENRPGADGHRLSRVTLARP